MTTPLSDTRGRRLHDLRISVTDRCNFRCTYCMPKEAFGRDFPFLPHGELLTFEETARLARIAVDLGVEKVRLTGGEPLLRRDVERLVGMLAGIDGLRDLTLTTNGSLLARKARALRSAGLGRVSVSLDSLDEAAFRALNDVDFPVARVLDGIEAARDAGLRPVKVNMVVKRGVNEDGVADMAARFRHTGVVVRFIEYMDVGTTNGWRLADVVPATEVLERVRSRWPVEPAGPAYAGEVARRYRYLDGGGEIGLVASVTRPFCGGCTRLRLSSDGRLFTCLFATRGTDLKGPLRSGATDAELRDLIARVWSGRSDRYSEIRSEATERLRAEGLAKVEMSRIGG